VVPTVNPDRHPTSPRWPRRPPPVARVKERGWGDHITERDLAVCLFAGLGTPIYLTREGRLLVGPCWPDDPPELREAKEDEAMGAFVIGARKFGRPELLTLLPTRPPTASTCVLCTGSRWVRIGRPVGGQETGEILCPECAGRGWRVGAEGR
jgi:hypothetical protein